MQTLKVEITQDGNKIFHYREYEMWVSYNALALVVEKYGISPADGAGECGFESFCEYLSLLPGTRYLGRHGDDIYSLVGMFDQDLKTFAKIEHQLKKEKSRCHTK